MPWRPVHMYNKHDRYLLSSILSWLAQQTIRKDERWALRQTASQCIEGMDFTFPCDSFLPTSGGASSSGKSNSYWMETEHASLWEIKKKKKV